MTIVSAEKLQFLLKDKNSSELIRVCKTLNLENIVGFWDELQKMSKLKQYASEILSFDGKFLRNGEFEYMDSLEIIDSAKRLGFSLNCRYKSFVEMLELNGIIECATNQKRLNR